MCASRAVSASERALSTFQCSVSLSSLLRCQRAPREQCQRSSLCQSSREQCHRVRPVSNVPSLLVCFCLAQRSVCVQREQCQMRVSGHCPRSVTLSFPVLSYVVSDRPESSVHGPSILVCFCPAPHSGMCASRAVSASEGARCQRSEF